MKSVFEISKGKQDRQSVKERERERERERDDGGVAKEPKCQMGDNRYCCMT